MAKRAVFLDRDGVVNRYVYNPDFGTIDSPSNATEFELLPGVGQAIAKLNGLGFEVVVASNQPGIAKGKFSPDLLELVTRKMKDEVSAGGGKIDAVYYCLHHPAARLDHYRIHCDCRKPGPGLLRQAASERNISLSDSYMIGDGLQDVLAGQAAGTKTFLISPSKSYVFQELSKHGVKPDYMTESLLDAAEVIERIETETMASGDAYSVEYRNEALSILYKLDTTQLERMVELLASLRERRGRLFLLGVGGGAGHASHAVCDFRKICGIESYSPSDNVSELTARVNDDGWESSYANWLRGSRLSSKDMVFVFSVGGGDAERNISVNLVRALQYAREIGASICGVVGRDGGFTARVADVCVLVPVVNDATVTPHTEAFQALVWHLLVSHPKLKSAEMKWESVNLKPADPMRMAG
jgi:D-sedoheptulose 7-phosphate isomerase